MVCSFKWTTLCLVLSIWGDAVYSQNYAGIPHQYENTNRESNCNNVSSKSQLMSTLLTVAAANGVLPDLLPVIQPALTNELPTKIPKTLNLIQLSNQNQRPEEPVVVTAKPFTSINQTPVVAPLTVSPYLNYNMPVLQTTFTPSLTQSHVCPVSQALRLENTPTGYPGAIVQPGTGIVQPIPAIWQAQPTVNRSPELWQPIVNEMIPESRPLPTNLQITPPSLSLDNESVIQEPVSGLPYDGTPVNLQINLPTQNSPPPHITVVSAPPGKQTVQETMPAQNRYPPFFYPPIVVDRSDSLDHILPIMLIALIANERDNCGCSCNCCCPCSSSKKVIPIPYPIPFPINSPIMNSSNRSSKNQTKSEKTNIDDDEDNGEKK